MTIQERQEYNKQYYLNHKKELNKKGREWHHEHKIEQTPHKKKYYLDNREEIIAKSTEYQQNHKEERKIYMNKYVNNLRQKNISFKITENLRRRINHAIKENVKSKHTMELLGCSIDELKKYLEEKFQEGMTWKNYGRYGWHIDHKKPCVLFDLSKEEEQKKCFHYTNLQPLWAEDNLSKGARI